MEKKISKKEHLYQVLKRRIVTLNPQPGSDLEEVSLSQEYDISGTPLRYIFCISSVMFTWFSATIAGHSCPR